MKPYHSIFREKALEEYRQGREKDILPRFLSPHKFMFMYILLGLLLLGGLLAFWEDVPIFMSGSGALLSSGAASVPRDRAMHIVLFLPARYASQLHSGAYTQMEVGPAKYQVSGTIKHVAVGTIGRDEARRRYRLNRDVAQHLPQKSVAVTVVPAAARMPQVRAGDPVYAQVQIGSRRILSLLFGL